MHCQLPAASTTYQKSEGLVVINNWVELRLNLSALCSEQWVTFQWDSRYPLLHWMKSENSIICRSYLQSRNWLTGITGPNFLSFYWSSDLSRACHSPPVHSRFTICCWHKLFYGFSQCLYGISNPRYPSSGLCLSISSPSFVRTLMLFVEVINVCHEMKCSC